MSLPPYTLRYSARAKRLRLEIHPGRGLVVVAPAGLDIGFVESAIRKRADWIGKHLERAGAAPGHQAPERVALQAVGRVFTVRYKAGDSASVRLAAQPASLTVSGAIADAAAVGRVLRAWLVRQAKAELTPWLAQEARRLGLSFQGVSVRLQRSRWGSCSARGGISLNACLLFLPRPMAAYVLAHELAHTVHLNHSPLYWELLERLHPGSRQQDKAMRQARQHVPPWAHRP